MALSLSAEQKKYNYSTEQQLQILAQEPLCTLGAHTCSHPKLYNLPKEEQQIEISEGKQWLEHLIQRRVDYFAYPYGAYSQSTLDIVSSIGFKVSFAAWGGPIRYDTLYNIL